MEDVVGNEQENAEATASFLKARQRGVKLRAFDLDLVPPAEVIPTGRTIKRMKAWTGHWPALREFFQNTIDHLGLLDPRTGRRHAALRLEVKKSGSGEKDGPDVTIFRFLCSGEAVCTMTASADELVIEQLYTFPIAPRALDTGVPDETKATDESAGGFGDGFKTAAVALLALGKDFQSLEWDFSAEGKRIKWAFEGATRAAVGPFAKCQVLQVRIEKSENTDSQKGKNVPKNCARGSGRGRDHIMRQVIQAKGIGRSFIETAVPRLHVFWDLEADSLVTTNRRGGDFMAPAEAQPTIGGEALAHLKLKPESGVYVRGIWVRPAKITGTLMCFFGRRLQVSGRDRNDVDDDDLVNAVAFLFRHCSHVGLLRRLLSPLRGKNCDGDPSESSTSSSSRRSTRSGGRSNWLLRSPRFLNRVLEQQKDFVLHGILEVPRGAIFVSSKTTKSADPFIKWASSFLERRGAPLVAIDPGANRYLFEEVGEAELTERCVDILSKDAKNAEACANVKNLRAAFQKILRFMGLGGGIRGATVARVLFSPDVEVAFVYGRHIFIPEVPLTRELVIKVLNVCQCHIAGADGELFSSLVQAIFETLPAGSSRSLTEADITMALARAKTVRKENSRFLSQSSATSSSQSSKKRPPPRAVSPEVVDLTGEEEPSERRAPVPLLTKNETGKEQRIFAGSVGLQEQISRVTRISENNKKRKRRGECGDDLAPIIPETEFGNDDAGHDSCLRPSSSLQSVAVDNSLGGGSLLCDPGTALVLHTWNDAKKARVAALREVLREASAMVCQSIPSLDLLLRRVRHGFDAANDTYEAFCDGRQIVVNLHAYLPKLGNAAATHRPRTLVHDFILMLTHELAHFLDPRGGHGPSWRDTHMNMVMEVMAHSSSYGRGPGGLINDAGISNASISGPGL